MKESDSKNGTPLAVSELALLEALPDAAFVIDAANDCIVRANARACEQTGFEPDEFAGMPLERLLDLGGVDELGAYLRARNADNRASRARGWLTRKSGAPLEVEICAPSFVFGGREYLLGQARPVAENHTIDTPKAENETAYRELIEDANFLIYTHDLDGRITSANEALLATFGLSARRALGMSIFDLVDESFHEVARSRIAHNVKHSGSSRPFELLCRSSDGSPIWLEISSRLIAEKAKPAGIQGIARDVTERKESAAALEISQGQVRSQRSLIEGMIDQNPFAIAFWRPDGTFERCNEAFVRLVGVRPFGDYNLLLDPQVVDSPDYEKMRRAFTEREMQHVERLSYDVSVFPGFEGPPKPVWMSVTLFPVVDAEGSLISMVSIYQDLAPQLESESIREKLEAQLRQSQKMEAIGRLAGGVAHDFNNLLTGVIGYLDLIGSVGEESTRAYVRKAEKAAQRACELTAKLLAYARKSPIEPRPHDLNTTANEVAALIRQTVDRRIGIDMDLASEKTTVNADPGQMSQVVMNLCINARDAIGERLAASAGNDTEGREPVIRIETRFERLSGDSDPGESRPRAGDYVRLSVLDNGTGMDAEVRRKIFEPFFTTKPQGEGTGLGLATLFGIVEQHGGWVDVESELGEGSAFHVFVPYIDAEPVPLSTAGVSLRVRGGAETILLIDDEEMIRELGRDVLTKKGYKVVLAVDGQDGLEVFERKMAGIDLVLLDLTMPRRSGIETLPRLIEMKPSIKVVASSGYSSDDRVQDLLRLGAAAFVQKPYTAAELCRTVRRVLDS